MRVFITGGSGFVGQEVIRQLLAAGHEIKALARNIQSIDAQAKVVVVEGDVTRPETLAESLSGCDAVIHLVGIIRENPAKGITFKKLHEEATANMIHAAEQQGIKRFLQMSANGTRPQAQTAYHRSKWAAEEHLRASALDWTIFRPSLIYGPEDDFINMLAKMIRLAPVVPVIGDGQYRLQPVHVEAVAASFVAALDKPQTIGKVYSCCGPRVFTYDQLLDTIARVLGQVGGARKLHQPLALMKPLISTMQNLPFFPITSDQLTMLTEGNICSDESWKEEFNPPQRKLEEAIASYLRH